MKEINLGALKEGYTAGLVRELIPFHYSVAPSNSEPSARHRFLTGNVALALGLLAAGRQSGKKLFFASYPITPASSIFHTLANYQEPDLITYQAEDEIAAAGSAIGASYGGHLGVVATSGPGMTLMSEAIGLAVMAELPLVVIDVQRAGPSTGMPTKTSQGDLFLALYGRNDSSPVVVLATHSPSDCFDKAYLACKIALERCAVVILLSDAFLASSHEVWNIRSSQELPSIHINYCRPHQKNHPYERHPTTGSRPWIIPGTPGYEHTLGGLEKTHLSGVISYDGSNHETMIQLRLQKILRTQELLPPIQLEGNSQADTLLISWGSTYGAIKQFICSDCQIEQTKKLAHLPLSSLFPLPDGLIKYFSSKKHLLVIESNQGQACSLLRDKFPEYTFFSVTKNDGKPWSSPELHQKITPFLTSSEKKDL